MFSWFIESDPCIEIEIEATKVDSNEIHKYKYDLGIAKTNSLFKFFFIRIHDYFRVNNQIGILTLSTL